MTRTTGRNWGHRLWRGSTAVLTACLLACGGGDDGGAGPTADLSGTVRDADASTPIAGASVSAGGQSATTAGDGSYALPGLRATEVTLNIEADGYLPASASLDLQAGANTHDVQLTAQTIFEFGPYTAYLPPGIDALRGVVFLIGGFEGPTAGLIRGDLTADPWHARLRSFAQEQRFALLGEAVARTTTATGSSVVDPGLVGLASAAGHRPELQHAPVLLIGYSWGGCRAYEYAAAVAPRVIGFITMKGGCHPEGGQPAARTVPGYIFVGEDDTFVRRENLNDIFEANRVAGAPWAIAIEPGVGHELVADLQLVFQWLEAVSALRLPAGPPASGPVPLIPVIEADGWLGHRQTFEICGFACYADDPADASWLPSQSTALSWQRFVSADGGGSGE